MKTNNFKQQKVEEYELRFHDWHVATNSEAKPLGELQVYEDIKSFIENLLDDYKQAVVGEIDEIIRKTESDDLSILRTKFEYKEGYQDAKNDIRIKLQNLTEQGL